MDQNVIEHLFDVERGAAELLSNAQTEYDKRLEIAHTDADKKFKEAYEKIINENESVYEKSVEMFKEEHKKELDLFCSEVENWPQNKQSFNELLEKLFFKA